MGDPLRAPAGWIRVESDLQGVNHIVAEPESQPGPGGSRAFRSNLVVTTWQVTTDSFGDWQIATDVLLDETLPRYQLIDLERLEFAGHPAGRRLAHHAGPAGQALTLEQWFVLTPGVGHTLSATVSTDCYDELADTLAEAASTWEALSR